MPENKNAPTTHIHVVRDRSGSMQSCREDMDGGFKAFLEEQRQMPDNCFVWLHDFDDEFKTRYSAIAVTEAEVTPLNPRGMTALLDAIGKTVGIAEDEIDPDTRVFLVIITDGLENASREYGGQEGLAKIKKLLERKQKAGWEIVYLGANQDAIGTAGSMGIGRNSSVTYDSFESSDVAFATAGSSILRSRVGGQSVSFTDEERAKTMGVDE
jgi:hypothetical protein